MSHEVIIEWLLAGDVAIQYQTSRDLLNIKSPKLREKINLEGWGARFLSCRRKSGHWGNGFYQPKWISSHYTLLDLKNLQISPNNASIKESIQLILDHEIGEDGGVNPSVTINQSDVCINGMFLNYACYFQSPPDKLHSIVDFILDQKMKDGGFNCRFNRNGASHSSLHSTLSVLEGIHEYEQQGCEYRLKELKQAEISAREFILIHQLYLSDRTGNVINPSFLRFPYPPRWKYDILRALDYFQYSDTPFDDRMVPALHVILHKRRKDQRWNLHAKHPGKIHFEMEKAGNPSRWSTLRALRVLMAYEQYMRQ